ncbi:M20 family peptidase [Fulvimarina endophytica]|uniref:M20 family peptidase n=1 Tax=Fulvimarina endophytica TaxID=2293836 RepID=A0A371WYJ9_9HYPH|nr:M20 family metallopeptidase [Fulvimarina endophytica]RFC62042.1 M20 family peptidase [Fulvimarina endophytica]
MINHVTTPSAGDAETWLEGRQAAMIGLLADLVAIDSPSRDRAGVDAVGARIAAFLASEGIETRTERDTPHGKILSAETGEGAPFLLLGHRDTVFPAGEAARRPFREAAGRAYGPGVADMKAGLVMNAFALAALHRHFPAISCRMLTTVDEEIGSPFSREAIETAARASRAVFNSEPARASGNIVSGRKGGVTYHLTVTGRAAHAGVNFTEGRSAIHALARKIVRLAALTRAEEGVTVNVGTVHGGSTFNTVAESAVAEIDTRFVTHGQRDELKAAIAEIAEAGEGEGISACLRERSEFYPLVADAASEAMARAYLDAAKAQGIEIGAEFTGGCADSGFTASVGTPTLCGVGPVGGKAHTVDEYIEVQSLLERTKVLVAAMQALA